MVEFRRLNFLMMMAAAATAVNVMAIAILNGMTYPRRYASEGNKVSPSKREKTIKEKKILATGYFLNG